MFNKFINQSQKLIDQGRSFVVALVVNYEGPISGKPGDRGIVTEDGELWGWVAGGCSQSIIVEEALQVLSTGVPSLIQITPESEGLNNKVMKRKMTCHSGGTLDVFLEPVIPKPQIVVLGDSVVAEKLSLLGKALDYNVINSLDKKQPPINSIVVVATQGDGDEEALEKVLSMDTQYLGFVASSKKAKALKEILATRGISAQKLDKIKAPAGLDIKARNPEEIALSILAEIILTLRQGRQERSKDVERAIDPICGMSVDVTIAKYFFEHQDTRFYFCCEGCQHMFAQEPEKYLVKSD